MFSRNACTSIQTRRGFDTHSVLAVEIPKSYYLKRNCFRYPQLSCLGIYLNSNGRIIVRNNFILKLKEYKFCLVCLIWHLGVTVNLKILWNTCTYQYIYKDFLQSGPLQTVYSCLDISVSV